MPPNPTSKSDLVKDLKSTYKELGKHYMSVNDYQSVGKYSQTIVYRHFKSWKSAMMEIGLPPVPNDLTGQKFGHLTVLEYTDERLHGQIAYRCLCDCGNEVLVMAGSLRNGATRSCGHLGRGDYIANRKKMHERAKEYFEESKIDGVRPDDYGRDERSDNTSGYTGVWKDKNRWVAELIVRGYKYRAYGFKTAEEAFYEGRLKLEEEHLPKEVFEKMQKKRQQKNG